MSNVDLAATIAEFTGVTPGLPQNGRSFLSVITDTATTWDEEVFMELHKGPARAFYALRVPGWTYAEYGNGDRELYDLTADPYQLQNLADNPAYQSEQQELADRIRVLRTP